MFSFSSKKSLYETSYTKKTKRCLSPYLNLKKKECVTSQLLKDQQNSAQEKYFY